MPEWFADDSFWAELYPFEFPAAVLENGESQVGSAISLSGVSQGAALDLGCGPGRHAIALAKRGFLVTAVDLSPFHLANAAERAAAANVSIEFVREDMRSFVRSGTFDLALSLFTSFGYFDDKRDDLKVLANIHESLRPGACLVMDVMSKERLAKVFQPTASQRAADGSLLVQRHEILDDWTRVKNEWTIIRDGRLHTFDFNLRVYSGQELKDLLGAAGFSSVKLYGGLDGRPYALEVERLVALAVK